MRRRRVYHDKPPRGSDRKFLHASHVAAALALVAAFFALRELVDRGSHPHHRGHTTLWFLVAASLAVVFGLGGKLLVMIHREREEAEFDERLLRERERESGRSLRG